MTNLFNALIDARPDRVAIKTSDGRAVTYGALDRRSAQYGAMLRAQGVSPGDRVLVQVEKSVEAVALYLGCLRAGAIFLPLNTAYTAIERDYFIGDADPALVVVDPTRQHEVGDSRTTLTLGPDGCGSASEAADASPAELAVVDRADDDLAAILYTSGTTGRSKGAMLTHANLLSNARTLVEAWRFTGDDVLLHALPIYHVHGLFVGLHVLLLAGAQIIFLPRFDPDEVIALLPQTSTFMGVPTFYTRLLNDPRLTADLVSHMRLFVSGSAPLLAETHRAWKARTGHAVLERYGMTETGMNASNPYEGARVPGMVGPALPGISLRVTDLESGSTLPTGEVGMLEVKGANVFKGYWRMPEKTAEEFREDGYFITGDLATIDQAGYVQLVGRGKDLIITGGFNVYPKEIEDEINAVDGVGESAVVGLPHADFGEGVTAIVVRAPGSAVDEGAIMDVLRQRLANFKLPKAIIFADELPRNTMGKVQKNMLREIHANLYEAVA